jgi:hypothetical protein
LSEQTSQIVRVKSGNANERHWFQFQFSLPRLSSSAFRSLMHAATPLRFSEEVKKNICCVVAGQKDGISSD